MKHLIFAAALAIAAPAAAEPAIIYSTDKAPLDLKCDKPLTMSNGRCVRKISAEPETVLYYSWEEEIDRRLERLERGMKVRDRR